MLQQEVDWERLEAIIASHAQEKWGLIPLLQEIQEISAIFHPRRSRLLPRALRMSAQGFRGSLPFMPDSP